MIFAYIFWQLLNPWSRRHLKRFIKLDLKRICLAQLEIKSDIKSNAFKLSELELKLFLLSYFLNVVAIFECLINTLSINANNSPHLKTHGNSLADIDQSMTGVLRAAEEQRYLLECVSAEAQPVSGEMTVQSVCLSDSFDCVLL